MSSDDDERTLIIGVGNPYRGDDAIGLYIAWQLMDIGSCDFNVLINYGNLTEIVSRLNLAENIIFIDAVHSGAKPGTILRFDANRENIPVELFRFSSHAFSIPEAIALAKALGARPKRVIVYCIEGRNYEIGEGLSPEVEEASNEVIENILEEIEKLKEDREVLRAG